MRSGMEDLVSLTQEIVRGYYQGDLEPWFSRLCPGSVWLGTGGRILVGGEVIRASFKGYRGRPPARICRENYISIPLGPRCGAVAAEVTVGDRRGADPAASAVYTFVYRVLAGETRLVLLHAGYTFVRDPGAASPAAQLSDCQFVRDLLLDLPETGRLAVPAGGQTLYVQPRTIFYIQSRNRRAELHCADGVIRSNLSINQINALLPPEFCPIHRTCTVNTRYAAAVRRYSVTLITGETLPIPVHSFQAVKADLDRRITAPPGGPDAHLP